MILTKLKEAGWEQALLGMSLSYYDHTNDLKSWWEIQLPKAIKRAEKLAHLGGNSGESKFLESIQVWLFIQGTRGFWQEFDTYRVGVTKQSASTMHTLSKRAVTTSDFSPNTHPGMVATFNARLLDYHNPEHPAYHDVTTLKDNLPEGWLQERVVCTNYKVLQHIYNQRHKHRYKYWPQMMADLIAQLDHPEYIIRQEPQENQNE
jgi:hypothetical protein